MTSKPNSNTLQLSKYWKQICLSILLIPTTSKYKLSPSTSSQSLSFLLWERRKNYFLAGTLNVCLCALKAYVSFFPIFHILSQYENSQPIIHFTLHQISRKTGGKTYWATPKGGCQIVLGSLLVGASVSTDVWQCTRQKVVVRHYNQRRWISNLRTVILS